MNLSTWAKLNGKTIKEAKELTGLSHHMAKVPESFGIEQKAAEPKEVKVEPPKKKEVLPDGITPEAVWFSCRCHNKRSNLWTYRSLAKAPSNYRGRAIIFN